MLVKTYISVFLLILGITLSKADDNVLGSLIVRCNEPILYSKNSDARFTSEFIDTHGQSKIEWKKLFSKECPTRIDEILEVCISVFPEAKSVIRGPSMFPITYASGSKQLVRPVFCLKTSDYNPSILSPSGCVFRVLSSDEKKSPDLIEILARNTCEKVEMQLYQSMPLMSQNGEYRSIEYVCCPRMDREHSNWDPRMDPFAIKVPLIDYNDIRTTYKDELVPEAPKLPEAPQVLGSFVIYCNEFLAFTRLEDHARIEPSNSLSHDWIQVHNLPEVNQCSSINEVWYIDICKKIYPGSKIYKAMSGIANVKLNLDDEKLVRPVWCLGTNLPTGITPPSANECTFKSLEYTEFCQSQKQLENIARELCNQNSKNVLYSAVPVGACLESAWVAGGYQSLEFHCCKEGTVHELLRVNELTRKLKRDPNPLKQSAINSLRASYDRVKKNMETESQTRVQHIFKKYIHELILSHQISTSNRSERQEIEQFNNAIRELKHSWESEEDKIAKVEGDEYKEIESTLQRAEQSSDKEIQIELKKQELDNKDLQIALAHLLFALNDVVNENLRHLNAVREHQPWRFLPLDMSHKDYKVTNGEEGWNAPILLAEVHKHILNYVNHARDRIFELRKIFWRLSNTSNPKFDPELTNAYDTLQATLRKAIKTIEGLNVIAKEKHQNKNESVIQLENENDLELDKKHLETLAIVKEQFQRMTGIKIVPNEELRKAAGHLENESLQISTLMKIFWTCGIVFAVLFCLFFVFLLFKKCLSCHVYSNSRRYQKCEDFDMPPEYPGQQNIPTNSIDDILKKINNTRLQHTMKRSDSNNYLYGNEAPSHLKGLENPIYQHYNP